MKIAKYASEELAADERENLNGQSMTHLRNGDQIMVSVTAQISVDGQDAWVKYGAVSTIAPNETAEAADHRVIEHVTSQVIAVAEQTAARIINHQ